MMRAVLALLLVALGFGQEKHVLLLAGAVNLATGPVGFALQVADGERMVARITVVSVNLGNSSPRSLWRCASSMEIWWIGARSRPIRFKTENDRIRRQRRIEQKIVPIGRLIFIAGRVAELRVANQRIALVALVEA